MKNRELKIGSVVQLSDNTVNKAFAFCFMIVTEPKSFGAMGYVQCLGDTRDRIGGQAFYRETFENMEYIGESVWMITSDAEGK